MKQAAFWKDLPEQHGGEECRGKRKNARPLATKQPLHATLKSTRARGAWSFFRHGDKIEGIIRSAAKRGNIRVYRWQNVGNHLHLLIQGKKRFALQNFLREVAGLIAAAVTGAKRGNAIGRFWDDLVHTRIVHWGRDWKNVLRYLEKNRLEAAGVPRRIVDELYDRIRQAIRDG